MKTLVAVASRHGSTEEIARAITEELRAAGLGVDLSDADAVTAVDAYDAVVLGSAVYMGAWLPEACEFVERHRLKLASLPVWLFSSGPLGAEDPKPHGEPSVLPDLIDATHPRGHQIFAGKLDPQSLGLSERLVTRLVRAPAGDFRVWQDIRAWARAIAVALSGAGPDGQRTGVSGGTEE